VNLGTIIAASMLIKMIMSNVSIIVKPLLFIFSPSNGGFTNKYKQIKCQNYFTSFSLKHKINNFDHIDYY